jgi:hypothetical protein
MTAITLFLLLFAIAGDPCEVQRLLPRPQPAYVVPDEPLVIASNVEIPHAGLRMEAPSGNFYFIELQGTRSGIVVVSGRRATRLEFRGYAHRPVKAKWINGKLLHLSTSFNPHAGAYAIHDAERNEILIEEAEHDGVIAWEECRRARP